MDFLEELEKDGDSIACELTVVATEKGKIFIMLPEDCEEPEQIDVISTLLCQLIVGWTMRLKNAIEVLQSALVEKNKRIIPVSIMPKDLKL